jgi:hypothetical protein
VHNVADVEVVGSSPAEGANMRFEERRSIFYFKDVNKTGGPDAPPFDPKKIYELMQRIETWEGEPRVSCVRGRYPGESANLMVKLIGRSNNLRQDDFIGGPTWRDVLGQIEK